MELIWSTVLTVWGWLLDHLLYINLAFSIIIIFFQRRDPRSVWTWLLALYFIPVFGIVFYLLFGQDMKKSRMFRVKEVSDRLNLPVKSQEDIIRSDDMPEEMMDPMSRDFKSLIIYNLETSGSVLTVNNQVQIYTDGQVKPLAQQAYGLGGSLPIQQQFEYTSLELFYSHEQNSKNIEISKISRHG